MKFIDFFAGVGGFRRGMELAGHECVGFCEFDKFATASYTSMHLLTQEQREFLDKMPLKQRQKEILKEEYRNGVEKREATISELNTELCNARAEAKTNEIPEELVQEMYCMAYDKEAEADGKMEKAADRMAAVIVAGEDVCGFAEEYKKQKENRSRYRKVMEELDKRERRRAGRE